MCEHSPRDQTFASAAPQELNPTPGTTKRRIRFISTCLRPSRHRALARIVWLFHGIPLGKLFSSIENVEKILPKSSQNTPKIFPKSFQTAPLGGFGGSWGALGAPWDPIWHQGGPIFQIRWLVAPFCPSNCLPQCPPIWI